MNHKKYKSAYLIMFFISILLISISVVSSIGVWKNRSFYFKDYIYNQYISSALGDYCADVHRFVTGNMTKEEAELFQSENKGIYYYITNNDGKEIFTNMPDGKSYIEFSSQADIVSLEYINNPNSLIGPNDGKTVETPEQPPADTTDIALSGYVFIDKNVGELLSVPFRLMLENGFNLRKILFLEGGILAVSLLLGTALFLISFKKAMKHVIKQTDFIPIDVKLGLTATALTLWIFLYGTYSYTIVSFFMLIRRLILYSAFVLLTFVILSFLVLLVLKIRQYAVNKLSFTQEWESRLTKSIPSWIIGLVLQLGWYYFFLLTIASPASTVYDYMWVIKHRWPAIIVHNVIILLMFVLIRQVWKSKAIYPQEVLNMVREIANGNLNLKIPVVGNDFYAQIAAHINTIKASHIQALNEQKKSERLKYELVTNISHDLRTPLTSILNYIGLAKKKGVTGDVEKYIDRAEINAKRLNILIEDLFELSKLESGSLQLDISNVDLVLMIKQVGHEYGEKMKQNGLELILESTDRRIIRPCDSLKMWRVFDNLINNAVKYSLHGTRIYVSIAEESGQLAISVKNIAVHRIDFEPDELFLRFKRGDDARNSEGSGLGLAIAKSIVALHNGSIAIETEGDMFKVIIRFI